MNQTGSLILPAVLQKEYINWLKTSHQKSTPTSMEERYKQQGNGFYPLVDHTKYKEGK